MKEKKKIRNYLDILLLLLLLGALRHLGLLLCFLVNLQVTQKLAQEAGGFGSLLLGFRLSLNEHKLRSVTIRMKIFTNIFSFLLSGFFNDNRLHGRDRG